MNPLFGISEEEIARLPEQALVDVLNRLLRAEGSRIGLLPTNIQTSLRIHDPDGGVDACVRDCVSGSHWIPEGLSVWQFKSGEDHEPAKLKKEFRKPGVQESLKQGGRYCVVIGKDLSNPRFKRRRQALDECCRAANIPLKQCQILTAAHVAQWASEHPATWFLPYFSRPALSNWMRWERWATLDRFQQPFKPDQARQGIIVTALPHLSGQSDILHVRLEGQAGVGKTRLALEIFRPQNVGTLNEDGFCERVMYAGRLADIPQGLFQWIEVSKQTQLVLAVDECDQVEADRLSQQAQRCDGRVRLLTIGQAQEARAAAYRPPEVFWLDKLNDEAMRELLKTAAPNLPNEHLDYIVRLSSGFVKLAAAIVAAVQRHPDLVAARDLAKVYEVTQVLRQFLLPNATDFRAMQAAALLTRIGWEEELKNEGETVVKFLSIDWNDAAASIQRQFNEGLVSKQGRYRYVTPHLLAVWLAAEAWEAQGSRLLNLIPILPTWNSRRALLERLRDLGDDPRAQELVRSLLSPNGIFQDVESINDEARAEIFALLAESYPRAGLAALERLLGHLPRDELHRFDKGRRHIVWVLEKLAWLPEMFFSAARLLLTLAEAENERWGNNSSGIWTGLFSTSLGGTAVPAIERHQLIAEALESPSVERQLLALRAIRKALEVLESRSVGAEHQGGRLVPPEWHPRTRREDQAVRLSALTLLDRALASSCPSVQEEAEHVLLDTAWNIATFGLADAAFKRLEHLPIQDDAKRRKVRNVLDLILEEGGGYLGPEQRKRLELLREPLISGSFHDRLRRWVGEWTHADRRSKQQEGQRPPEGEAAALAAEAMHSPELLRPEIDWLSSSEAKHVYHFARRLGELDTKHYWWIEIERRVRAGQGLAFASAYLQGNVDAGHRNWREAILDQWVTEGSGMAPAVLDAIWRGEPDDRDAQRLILLMQRNCLPPEKLRTLVWGGQTKHFSTEAFRVLIDCLLCSSAEEAATAGAIELLEQRFDFYPGEIDSLEPLAWRVLERRNIPLQDSMVKYHWNELVCLYLPKDPARIGHIILSFFQREESSFIKSDPVVQTLAEATRLAPDKVWPEVASKLLANDMASFRLNLSLRGWYAREVGEERLLNWAEQNQPEGPRIAAELTPIGEVPLNSLARELLIRFGHDEDVASALYANFGTGSWSGPPSGWIRSRLDTARQWLKDPHPAVRDWARREAESLEQQLAQVALREAEGIL